MVKFVMPNGAEIYGAHESVECEFLSSCVIHRPSDHHMVTWGLNWRNDKQIFERLCSHGEGHPDPDQFPYWEATGQYYHFEHECDGCCIKANAEKW